MKTSFSVLFIPVLALAWILGSARPASAAQVPCFCQYDQAHADFQSAGGDAPRFCPNEVYWIGNVEAANALGAVAVCTQRCTAAGTHYVGITSKDPNIWNGYANPSDMVRLEEQQCVFTAFQNPPNAPSGWSSATYGSCLAPLPYTGNMKTLPQSCSFCFCKFKEGPGQTPSCGGKTTLVKITSYPGKCDALCSAYQLDPIGRAEKSPDAHCQFTRQDNCAKPLNPEGSGCKTELGSINQAASEAAFQASRGTVIGQFLPLGNISLPQFIGRLIKQLLGVVGAIALVFFLWGGLKYMTASGDDKKFAEGRDMIVAAVSGLAAIFLSYAILSLIINALQ